jgi:hypothetical protein
MTGRPKNRRGSIVGLALATSFAAWRPAAAQVPAYAATAMPRDTVLEVDLRRDIEEARSRGLPAEPLLAKVREGQLKRAAAPRIRAAVAALASRLDSARAAIGAAASPDELVAGAEAIAAGAPPGTLRTIRAAAGAHPIAVPLGALAQLVANGVAPRRAAEMIVELLRRNAASVQLLAFGNAVESDVTAGVPADEAATFRLQSIMRGGTTFTTTAVDGASAAPQAAGLMPSAPAPPAPPRRKP